MREERGIPKTRVAEALGITEGAYRAYENGRSEPDLEKLVLLSRFFGVSTDYLLGETDI